MGGRFRIAGAHMREAQALNPPAKWDAKRRRLRSCEHLFDCSRVKWSRPPPGTLADIDVHGPDVEVLPQAWVDEAGAPHARQVELRASRHARLSVPAYVIAWARPTGAPDWRWVLLMWLDKPIDPPGSQQWRYEWLEPNMALIRPAEGNSHAHTPSAVSDALASL